MEYIKYIKAKAHIGTATKSNKPVLSDEDEQFLNKITNEGNPAPYGAANHGGDAQIALLDGAQNIALPPDTPDELTGEQGTVSSTTADVKPTKSTWSWLRRDSRNAKRETTAAGLHDIAQDLKSRPLEMETPVDVEAKKEEEDMTEILEKLNLAAVDNRVFSVSDETRELLEKFNQILKDLMNGVPTAYRDLESLLTNGDKQIQKTYNSLPSFLQKLVEKLPETMTKGIAPEMMAAASARAANYGINLEKSGKAAGSAARFLKTPSLQDLLGKPGAITAMLRSIMQFLRTRFPAFAGINVLWTLALSLLLIVFWYCHKRGREVRLEKDRELTEQEVAELEREWKEMHPDEQREQTLGAGAGGMGHHTTTAPPGATMDQVRAGIVEADAQRIAAAAAATSQPAAPSAASTTTTST